MENIQTSVGKKIAESRKKMGLNQVEFAEKLGKSLRTVQKYESGEIDLPLSILANIADLLNVSINYLVGYEPQVIKVETLSDVIGFLFEIDRKQELRYDIEVEKDTAKNWNCTLKFNGNNKDAEYNADLCLVLETFRDNREALETYWMGYETFDAWEEKTLEYHRGCFLSNIIRESLDSMELIKRRNELEKKKLEKMLADMQAKLTEEKSD